MILLFITCLILGCLSWGYLTKKDIHLWELPNWAIMLLMVNALGFLIGLSFTLIKFL